MLCTTLLFWLNWIFGTTGIVCLWYWSWLLDCGCCWFTLWFMFVVLLFCGFWILTLRCWLEVLFLRVLWILVCSWVCLFFWIVLGYGCVRFGFAFELVCGLIYCFLVVILMLLSLLIMYWFEFDGCVCWLVCLVVWLGCLFVLLWL